MLTPIDYAVIVIYLVGVALFGILAAGRQEDTGDYFLGGRSLPWWAVCFSVVATETSTLTVVGTPAVAFGGSMTFLQLTFGYLIGRTVVAIYLLPRYYQGQLNTAYAFLGNRFGNGMRATASVTFLVTRLLADGVRLFATAIPLKIIADSAGVPASYFDIILVIGGITIIYTLIGGIKAVVWMDVVQMLLYVGGAVFAIVVLLQEVPSGWWNTAAEAGKTEVLSFDFGESVSAWLTQPYSFITAVVGGGVFSMASHGADQLIVQRLLTCRNLRDSQKAIVGSGFVVMLQFALFLFVGLLLWSFYAGATVESLGLTRGDEIFPKFIVEEMPRGVSGLLLAGIVAAAMSTLSSSLNSLASSTMLDLYERLSGRTMESKQALRTSRVLTLFWGIVFIGFANLFTDQQNPVVELGLAIASFTYGGLLGSFLLGLWNDRTREADAVIAFIVSIAFMVFVIFCVWYVPGEGWTLSLVFPWEDPGEMRSIGWPWFTVIGSAVTVSLGSLLALRHR